MITFSRNHILNVWICLDVYCLNLAQLLLWIYTINFATVVYFPILISHSDHHQQCSFSWILLIIPYITARMLLLKHTICIHVKIINFLEDPVLSSRTQSTEFMCCSEVPQSPDHRLVLVHSLLGTRPHKRWASKQRIYSRLSISSSLPPVHGS